jgi:multisubunit Na+/H+ antiporter MnhC subunit
MPLENALILGAIVVAFLAFAVALAWVDATTRRARREREAEARRQAETSAVVQAKHAA